MSYFKHERALVADGAQIGEGTRIWANTNILEGAIIGSDCNICDGCFVEKGAVLGNNVTLKNNVSVFNGVTLEDDVFVGANTAFVNDRFPRSKNKEWKLEKVVVEEGATIGAGATILCGVTIGKYAFVGAGGVVTKDVPEFSIVVGNPARYIGRVNAEGKRVNE